MYRAILVIIAWLVTLAIGFNVSSRTCFAALTWHSPLQSLGNLALGGLAFTPSNIAVLSILSVYIGISISSPPDRDLPNVERNTNHTDATRTSALCGAVVFFVVFFGGSWLDKSKFINASQEDYFTIASACIALGLATGFNPDRVKSLITGSPPTESE